MPFNADGAFERPHSYALHRAKAIDPSPEHFDREADDVAQGLTELRALVVEHNSDIRNRLLALEKRDAPAYVAPVIVAPQQGEIDAIRGEMVSLAARLAALENAPRPVAIPAAPPIDLRPVMARIEALERRPQAPDWTPALSALDARIAELEEPPIAPPPSSQNRTLATTSFRDLLTKAESDLDELDPILSRLQAVEDQIAILRNPPAPRRAPTRDEAIDIVRRAALWPLLYIMSEHVLYELALLSMHDQANAVAAGLLKALGDDTAAIADSIVRRREGTAYNQNGSEWDMTVRIVAAREKAIADIKATADDGIMVAMQNGIDQITRIGGS